MGFGYKELVIKSLGSKCGKCGSVGDESGGLTVVGLEESPRVLCKVCADKDGHNAENVCDAHMTQNNQVTIATEVREKLNIEPKDLVFIKVIKVISPDGDIKYGG